MSPIAPVSGNPAGSVKTKRDERLWEKAKAAVAEQYPDVGEDSDRYWSLVQGIYQKMSGKKSQSSLNGGSRKQEEAAMKSANELAAAAEELRRSLAVSSGKTAEESAAGEQTEEGTLATLAKGLLGAVGISQKLLGLKPLKKAAKPADQEPEDESEEEPGDESEEDEGENEEEAEGEAEKSAAEKSVAEKSAAEKSVAEKGLGKKTTLAKSPSAKATVTSIVNRTGDKAGDEELPVLLAEPLLKSLVEVHGELAEQLGVALTQLHQEIGEVRKGLAAALKLGNATAHATAALLFKAAESDRQPLNPTGRGILGQVGSMRAPVKKSVDGTIPFAEAEEALRKAGITRGDVQVRVGELIEAGSLTADAMQQFLTHGHVGFVSQANPDLRKALGL